MMKIGPTRVALVAMLALSGIAASQQVDSSLVAAAAEPLGPGPVILDTAPASLVDSNTASRNAPLAADTILTADSALATTGAPDSTLVPDSVATIASAPPKDSILHGGPEVPLVVRGKAPAGSQVTLDGAIAQMDSAGNYKAALATDSLARLTGAYELCLNLSGQMLCTKVRPQGFDTLDVAPLEIKIDSVIETRDTLRTIVDTTAFDSTALNAADAPKVVKSSAGRTVTVRGKRRPPRILGQERVTVQTIKRLPGLAEPDVIRAVQALPGVVQSSDFSTKIYVRGSSSDQNLILFDNAVVYSPAHFGGLFSTFLADATGGLDFYKGGFEPRFGNRLASVLLVNSKVGGTDRDSARDSSSWVRKITDKAVRGTESVFSSTPADSQPKVKSQSSVRVTTFSGSIATDGQQGDASWAFAGRRTWIGSALALARKFDLTDLQLDYDFWDVQGSAAYGHDGDTVRASIYTGRDKLDLSPISLEWGNIAAPINVRKKLGDDFTFFGSGSFSKYDQTVVFGDIFRFYNAIESYNLRTDLQWDPNPFHRFLGGYEFNRFDVNFTQDIQVASVADTSLTNSYLHSAFLQDRWTFDKTKSATFGMRGYWSPELGDNGLAADPRASFTWRFAPDWKLDLHVGHYTQFMTSLSFGDFEIPTEFWYAAQKPMDPTTQDLTAFGIERQNWGPADLRATFEGYYKNIRAVPLLYPVQATVAEDSAAEASGEDFFARSFQKLDGWSAGFEAALNKEDGWWTGSISYASSWAVLKQRDFQNARQSSSFDPFWANWDQRHTFKATGGLNWIGRKSDEALSIHKMGVGDFLRSSFQINLNSGLPYKDYSGYERIHEPMQGIDGGQGSGGPVPGLESNTLTSARPKNVSRKPGYFRLDITPIDWGRTGRWRFYYTIINVTDAQNLFAVNYNTRKNPPEKSESYQFPLLPFFLGYEYQF